MDLADFTPTLGVLTETRDPCAGAISRWYSRLPAPERPTIVTGPHGGVTPNVPQRVTPVQPDPSLVGVPIAGPQTLRPSRDSEMTDRIGIEIRFKEDESRQSPGRLFGILMDYETRAQDRPEVFKRGALSWPDNGIVVNEQHARTQPITRVVPEVRGSQVVVDVPLPDTQRGRDAATLIRNGTLTGLSVEFKSLRQALRMASARSAQRAS